MSNCFVVSTLRQGLGFLAASAALISGVNFGSAQTVEAVPSDDLTDSTTNFNEVSEELFDGFIACTGCILIEKATPTVHAFTWPAAT